MPIPSENDDGENDKLKDLLKDLGVIGEILSSRWKIKIFVEVCKNTRPDGIDWLSGYKLSNCAKVSYNTVYNFLNKMVEYGAFKRPTNIKGIKLVQTTEYGIYIYEKIKSILPKASEIL
jgi:predicted transcriptional regulator